jgi:glycosyltransferase involved in cell wall biosynthesis
MAEAMSLGRPVIATDFSGSTDFISARTAFPVPFTLRPLRPNEYVWSEGQSWAEPDRTAAAQAMRRVYHSPDLARERGLAGQAFVRQRYNPAAVGTLVEQRLEEIAVHLGGEVKAENTTEKLG